MLLKKTYCLSSWVVWSISLYSNALGHFLFDRTNSSLLKILFEHDKIETQNPLVKIISNIFLSHIAQVKFWAPTIHAGSTSCKLLGLWGVLPSAKKSLLWRLKQEEIEYNLGMVFVRAHMSAKLVERQTQGIFLSPWALKSLLHLLMLLLRWIYQKHEDCAPFYTTQIRGLWNSLLL